MGIFQNWPGRVCVCAVDQLLNVQLLLPFQLTITYQWYRERMHQGWNHERLQIWSCQQYATASCWEDPGTCFSGTQSTSPSWTFRCSWEHSPGLCSFVGWAWQTHRFGSNCSLVLPIVHQQRLNIHWDQSEYSYSFHPHPQHGWQSYRQSWNCRHIWNNGHSQRHSHLRGC